MLTNRERYLENRPIYLGFIAPVIISIQARPTYIVDERHEGIYSNRKRVSALAPLAERMRNAVMNAPDRSSSAPPDLNTSSDPRPGSLLSVVPALTHDGASGSTPSSPDLPSELNPRTPSLMEGQSIYSSEEQTDEDEAGSARAEDFPSPPGSSGEKEAESETREVGEEEDSR
ncbi:hypothetical protein CLAFUW4_01680 [Fulvia fulva]|uniref:Uncharacterized protein n=1 Tax=Passalora fulva TaxID=5499 RepID=A0A9Q8L8C3_PASFU|nr:uncharacterized protein CLAFUR5_01678 [Fulvia fulva]KAK4634397.1 hypothetical protein CLAFUR4_01678 [Fulvia fulva]KAK4638558.1 hypothetical protein CLAFUR0_01679 [Fulvia fulva]UJO12656.1 hypothetical protein CLAFUR5_01678 [Fulvia fulva]WPV08499.1 hypothetical protein CLAFUW4_01680 [Fulvia fulva]WPV24070.1 hypothetical protein CLAFUW7_01682 [Fulvia fulva]